jgi:hypothetical protein
MQTPETITEKTECRVVLLESGSRDVLAASSGSDLHRLIHLELSASERLAPQLHRALQTQYGLRGIMLDFISAPCSGSPCVVLELFTIPISRMFHPVPVDTIAADDLSQSERLRVSEIQAGRGYSPLTRPGWIDEAIAWVEGTIRQKVTSKLDIEQYSAGGAFTLLRISMANGRRVWLKATGQSNTHELPISCLLAKLCSGFVPEVLGIHTRWNAWLMVDVETSVNTPSRESVPWGRKMEYAVEALSALQLRTMGHEAELLAAGAFDQRIARLRADSRAMFERIDEAIALQTSMKADRISGARVRMLRSIFNQVCDLVEELNMPPVLIHGDMSADNLAFASDHCWFLDWCEAYIGWPFVTLEHLLLLNQPGDKANKAATDEALIARYCSAMSGRGTKHQQKRAIACMPFLAAASALYGRGEWIERSLENDVRRQRYVRTLARHMDRAAQTAALVETIRAHSSAAISKSQFASRRGEPIDAALPG